MFKFLSSCSDHKLREKIFQSTRKDLTEVRKIMGQHVLQLRSENTIADRVRVVAAVSVIPQRRGIHSGLKRLRSLRGNVCVVANSRINRKTVMCTETSSRATTVACPGQLPLCARGAQNVGVAPVKAIMEANASPEAQLEVTPLLPVTVYHAKGSFNSLGYPDTGSTAILMSSTLAAKHNVIVKKSYSTPELISVTGEPLAQEGLADLTIKTPVATITTSATVTPSAWDELIIGFGDLKKLKVVPPTFPNNQVAIVSPVIDFQAI